MAAAVQSACLADLAQRLAERTVVVGVGNELRGDDAAGPLVARKLAAALEDHPATEELTAIDCGDVPENYLGPILDSRPRHVVFCDAVDFGGAPGDIRLIDVSELSGSSISTHNASLSLLAKVLAAQGIRDQLVIGIQPKYTSFGSPCSNEVAAAVDEVVAALLECVTPVVSS